ncbi:MAG: hypothetical protein ABW019_11235 [Chitinophagaceae bacterium]
MHKPVPVLLLLCLHATALLAQIEKTIETQLPQVKAVPYGKGEQPSVAFSDSAYLVIQKLDKYAIPFLLEKLKDSSLTGIANTCTGGQYRVGDIALFLINDIEPIPYYMVTGMQWCLLGECGMLPAGFLDYVAGNRIGFYTAYRNFYYGDGRKEWRKTSKKRGKKKRRE